ncbi:hypothetical protein LguiA_026934 [Lonicera macranthoides]
MLLIIPLTDAPHAHMLFVSSDALSMLLIPFIYVITIMMLLPLFLIIILVMLLCSPRSRSLFPCFLCIYRCSSIAIGSM